MTSVLVAVLKILRNYLQSTKGPHGRSLLSLILRLWSTILRHLRGWRKRILGPHMRSDETKSVESLPGPSSGPPSCDDIVTICASSQPPSIVISPPTPEHSTAGAPSHTIYGIPPQTLPGGSRYRLTPTPGGSRPSSRASSRSPYLVTRVSNLTLRSRSPSPTPSRQRRSESPVSTQVESPTEDLSIELPQHGSIRTRTGSSTSTGTHVVAIPINPVDVNRYERGVVLKRRKERFEIEPMTRKFDWEPLPDDWVACAHPEGALYFYNASQNIFTEAYLYDPEMLELVTSFADQFRETIESVGEHLTNLELVVEVLRNEQGELTCGYYLADNEARTLLWLEPYDAEDMLAEFEGETSVTHLKIEMEARYWAHCEMFPNHRDVSEDTLNELIGILMHSSVDAMTSDLSLSPYSPQECQDLLSLVGNIRTIGRANGASACVVGRLFSLYGHSRFLHNFGQHGARLASNQSIYGRNIHPPRSRLLKMLSALSFFMPDVHLKSLEKMWVDHIMRYQPWKELMSQLQAEWEKLLIMSTIVLIINVSFLAIQSVDRDGAYRSPAQMASYFSTIASIGSIILGLLLVRKHRFISREDAAVGEQYLMSKLDGNRGLETLSIMYSLPYALLMWAMTLFVLAFSFATFELDVTFHSTNYVLRLLLGLAWATILALLTWFILTNWDGNGKNTWLSFVRWDIPQTWKSMLSTSADASDQKKRHWFSFWKRMKQLPPPATV
ncbi:hypothetical protein JAAARDRAFT_78181 [Jaapia argillacea MUCL 33604]|uniref:WW domain-containing protein n=1 Tax=Jaapia argillacea MUCL 33604 TaxID=933084 RepID=A0A067Q790_9AGAM|nr:hypothetical protein JAAARDRAFT_78181 [Jaapia argillacea MUCL 33604]